MKKIITAAAASVLMSSMLCFGAYAQSAAEDIGEGAGNVVENVGEGIGEVADGIGNAASDVLDGAGDAVQQITGGDPDEDDTVVNENDPTAANDLAEITDEDDIGDDADMGKDDEDLERIKEEQQYYDKGADANPSTGADAFAAASAIAGGAAVVAYLTKKQNEDEIDRRRR